MLGWGSSRIGAIRMKLIHLLPLGGMLLPLLALADVAPPPAADAPPPALSQQFGYAIGRDLAHSLQPVKDVLDLQALKQALDDAAAGKPGPYSDEELREAKQRMGELLQARLQAQREALAAANLKAATAFLQKNGKRKGVITTASGLQYEVLTAGKGPHPTADDFVTVNYRGTLADGSEFDSSYARAAPVSFPLRGVIPAWVEGLQLMPAGAKYRFYVPPALGYGERGAGSHIGPNEALVFEIELISFSDKAPE
ncbi:MAG: FKBP-type peptidyl-prolyl cis-trans isomerase [Nevskiaceae bacterium]|nr:MAG: FKBP-type peptidyl-prolyl cis-trans isomerase [Nevskiaceae bacterium]